jgi:hypothetical protein
MELLKTACVRLVTIGLGLLAGLIFAEILLHFIPEMTFQQMLSYRPIRYDFFQGHPDIGWVHRPNAVILSSSEGEYEVTVHINSKGLRDVEREYERPPDVPRVVILGDSFVEGGHVELSQNFSILLQTCLTERLQHPVEVINTGVSMYGPGEELLFLQHEGLKYRPDLVLTGFYIGNDFENLRHEEEDPVIRVFGGYQFGLEDGELIRSWISWEEPRGRYGGFERLLRRHSRLYFMLRNPESKINRDLEDWRNEWAGRFSEQSSSDEKPFPSWDFFFYAKNFPDNPAISEQTLHFWELLQAIIEETQAQAQASDAQYGVFLIPEIAQVDEMAYQEDVGNYTSKWDLTVTTWDITRPNAAMTEMLTARGILVLDLLPAFNAHVESGGGTLYFANNRHFTPEGHRLTAELLCDWVIDNQLIGP